MKESEKNAETGEASAEVSVNEAARLEGLIQRLTRRVVLLEFTLKHGF